MRYLTALSICWLSAIASFCQLPALEHSEITFSSNFEQRVFEDLQIEKKDYFFLFMANGAVLPESGIAKAKTAFLSRLEAFRDEKFKSKSNQKKFKVVYDDLNSQYLQRYDANARFEDIFVNGNFNSLTATMLYALAMQELDLPFEIRETPERVYLLAFPDKEKITANAPTTLQMVMSYPNEFKQAFVKGLRDQRVISAAEYSASSVNTLFDRYFYADEGKMNLIHLAGTHYYEEGIHLTAEKEYLKAYKQLEKAYLLNPSPRAAHFLFLAYQNAYNDLKAKDEIHATIVGRLSRFGDVGIKPELIQGELNNVIQSLLFDKGDTAKTAQYYRTLQQNVLEAELKNDLAFLYNYEFGRYRYNQARFDEALVYAERTLVIRPNNQDAVRIFLSSLEIQLNRASGMEALKLLQDIAARFPDILLNNRFNQHMGKAFLDEIQNCFEAGKPADGEKMRLDFETFFNAHPGMPLYPYDVSNAYGTAASYYFRKGQKTKAKQLIAAGLVISPRNYELERRQKMIQ